MQLSEGVIGGVYRVASIELEDNERRRFEILGMTNCTKLEVLNKKKNGAMIIKIRGSRFAIGNQFACGIMVTQEERNG